MKARDKRTGEIVDIEDMSIVTYKSSEGTYVKTLIKDFTFIDAEKDYYTKLEHQYAGMAMQTMLATLYNPKYHKELMACYTEVDAEEVARLSKYYAHALVEKLKEKEERK